MDIKTIRNKIKEGRYIISFSHTDKMRLRKIEAEEIEEAIFNGMIIEPYPDDPRGPSCLIMGFSNQNRPLHILCGKIDDNDILIITAYEPNPNEWEADWMRRKREVGDV